MDTEIVFFESNDEGFDRNPPHDDTHTACGTPNPPSKFCGKEATNIDMYLLLLIIAGIVVVYFNIRENNKIKI